MLLHERITHTDHRNGARKRIYLGAQLILRGSERMSARMAGRKEAEKPKAPPVEGPEEEKGEMGEDV